MKRLINLIKERRHELLVSEMKESGDITRYQQTSIAHDNIIYNFMSINLTLYNEIYFLEKYNKPKLIQDEITFWITLISTKEI